MRAWLHFQILCCVVLTGCQDTAVKLADDKVTIDQVERELDKAAEKSPNELPESVIDLPKMDGWVKTEMRGLPADGFSVGYNHPSGLAVTLYQYNRGLATIPNELSSKVLEGEFCRRQRRHRTNGNHGTLENSKTD